MVRSTGANDPNLKRYVGLDDRLLGKNQYNNHWNHRGWQAGGDMNNTHISFEICEDNLNDKTYFNKVYKEAVGLAAYLCKQYKLTEKKIIGHYEGYQK